MDKKATIKNFKEVKDDRYTLIQINPETMKRVMMHGGLNVISLAEEIVNNTKAGYLSIVLPKDFNTKLIVDKESDSRARITYSELMELINNQKGE